MSKTNILRGKARFCQILGKPRPGYGTEPGNGDPEWTFDLVLDEQGKKDFLKSGADKSYIKSRDGFEYVRFTRKAIKKDGTEAKPINVVNAQGKEWDPKVLIGNDSELNVAFVLNSRTYKGKTILKPSVISVQVWDLVKYVPKNSFPVKPEETETEAQEGENW